MEQILMIAGKILIVFGVASFVNWAVRSTKETNAMKKERKEFERQKSIREQREKKIKEEHEKKEAEFKKEKMKQKAEDEKREADNKKKNDTYVALVGACYATLQVYCKNKLEVDWIMEHKITPILVELAYKRQEDALRQFNLDGRIRGLGPFVFNKEQFREWHSSYLLAKQQEEIKRAEELSKRDMEIIREKNAKKRAEERRIQKWIEYKDKFKKLNKAQQKNEMEWFKNKVVDKIAIDENQKEEYIHELEIIVLAD